MNERYDNLCASEQLFRKNYQFHFAACAGEVGASTRSTREKTHVLTASTTGSFPLTSRGRSAHIKRPPNSQNAVHWIVFLVSLILPVPAYISHEVLLFLHIAAAVTFSASLSRLPAYSPPSLLRLHLLALCSSYPSIPLHCVPVVMHSCQLLPLLHTTAVPAIWSTCAVLVLC